MTLFLITLPKYKTAFAIQVLYTKYIFSVEVSRPFWSAGASPMLARRWSSGMDTAIVCIWISRLQSQLYQVPDWTCKCIVRGRLCGQVKIRSRYKTHSRQHRHVFISPELLGKGSRHLQGHFLLQEREWAPSRLNSLVIYKGLSIRGKQEEPKFCNWFLAERSTQKPPQIW